MRKIIITIMAALALSACSILSPYPDAPSGGPGVIVDGAAEQRSAVQQASARLIAQYATMKYIGKAGSEEARRDRAIRVVNVTLHAQGLVDTGITTTIPLIEKAVRDNIDWSRFDLADRMLVDNLIALIRQELEARMGQAGSVLGEEQRIAVSQMLGWVMAAAQIAAQ